MPQISARQLIDKTIRAERKANFYRVSDVNNLGDKAKPVSNMLPVGYTFKVDSFLTKTPAYTNIYGIRYAARKDDYITFFGKDGRYYAIKVQDIGLSAQQRRQAGIKTVEEEIREAQEANLTTLDKLARFGKYLAIGIAVVWAGGYIYKTTKK